MFTYLIRSAGRRTARPILCHGHPQFSGRTLSVGIVSRERVASLCFNLGVRSRWRQPMFLPLDITTSASRLNWRSAFEPTRSFHSPRNRKKSLLLVDGENAAGELDEIYSSPLRLFQALYPHGWSFETSSIVISSNGQDEHWFTTRINCFQRHYESGKFGEFIKSVLQSQSAENFYKTSIVDGKVYYTSEDLAREAAAARVIDDFAFSFYRKRAKYRVNENIRPVRYCVQVPLTQLHSYGLFSCSPMYEWLCVIQRQYGPVDDTYGIQSELFECDGNEDQQWFSATCFDPITKEAFESGIFGKNGLIMAVPHAPIYPLTLEEIKIRGGRVYYKREEVAKHAAAARALDCFYFRNRISQSIIDSSDVPMKFRYCLEEPYTSKDEKFTQSIDYAKLQNIVTKRLVNSQNELFYDVLSHRLQKTLRTSNPSGENPSTFLNAVHVQFSQGNPTYSLQNKTFPDSPGVWYTSNVADPLTGEVFFSGLVCEKPDTKAMTSCFAKAQLHLGDVKVFEGRVYYKSKSYANRAAAARAIDCYIFRDADRPHPIHIKPSPRVQLCLEDPYKDSDERDSQQVDYTELLNKRTPARKHYTESVSLGDVPSSFDQALSDMLQSNSCLLHVPSGFLSTLYEKKSLGVPRFSMYGKVFDDNSEEWYTSTVTDCLTGEEFHSGLIGKEVNATKSKRNLLGTPLHLAEVKVSDGRVYYQKKKLANHAAAARAIDCYIFRSKFIANEIGQICLEDPYASVSEGNAPQVDYDALLNKRSHFLATGYSGGDEHMSKSNHITDFKDDGPDNEETDDNFQFLAVDPSQSIRGKKHSTMGRIVEIWSEEQNQESLELNQSLCAQDISETKLNNVVAWFRRAYKSPQTHENVTALASLCKKVLSNLCERNAQHQLTDTVGKIIQKEGQYLWDTLISVQSRFIDDTSLIDTSICNAYIGCLDRYDRTSATSAEALLLCMTNRDKYGDSFNVSLPPPNVHTFNAVMSLWSRVDGHEGETGVNRVYSLLKDASLSPNIDTFKILMATSSKNHNNRFSLVKAKACLAEMEQVSKSLGKQSLRPNLDIYNAALKKSIVSDRHNTFKPSWLSSGKAHADGFRDATDNSIDEVLEMEEWCTLMEKYGTEANIDSYEAIIETCVNTGTMEGLLRAENWAKRVLMLAADRSNINMTPRPETFQPIIAAWTLCGNEHSPRRVAEWLNQLIAISTAMPHLSPDINMFASKIIAWRIYQTSVIEQSLRNSLTVTAENPNHDLHYNERKLSSEVDHAFRLAKNCLESLEEVLSKETNFSNLVNAEACAPMFVNCIAAFGDASRLAKLAAVTEPEFNMRLGVREMIKVLHIFDSKLHETLQVNKEEKAFNKLPIQCIGEIYSQAAAWLHQLDSTSSVNSGNGSSNSKISIFGERIADIERMLRIYEYYSRKEGLHQSSDLDCKSTRLNFYREILCGCQGVHAPSDYGNVVRICNLIMDNLLWSKEHHTHEFTAGGDDISDLFVKIALITGNCVMHPRERKLVLTKVYENARHFFYHNDKTHQFGRVDRSSLIGALRLASVDIHDSESFLSSLEDKEGIKM